MNKTKLFSVVGTDDLEGTVFVRCTTYGKAQNAKEFLEIEGFDEDMLEIIQDEILLDAIEIGGVFIDL